METTYNPKTIEKKWYETWEKNKNFKPKDNANSNPYCIMIPPPNVTGHLHMGHAFQDSIMDYLIRYNRMKGNKTLWQMGTDHAGIATQMVVERNLLKDENLSRHDLGREKFIEKIWDWKTHSGNNIANQLREMGASVDWDRERFTMDEGLSKAVQEVFIKLFEEGLIYRGKRLVNWDPVLHTAISDLEVHSEEEQGSIWHIRYPLKENPNQYLTVATTRPETMLGDVAVAVHPEDERYKDLIGKTLVLPISNREIPIIADEYVEQDFGTGCVKITPAHDFNDYEIGLRHNLEMINIFDIDAKVNDSAPERFRGVDRFKARKLILEELTKLELLEKEEPHTLKVPRGDRSGVVVEPYLTDQWFVKTESLAKPAIDAVKSGKIKFVPENWSKVYFEWMNNIQDWCISRQLWWGHRIPAWFDKDNNIYVGTSEADIRKKHNIADNVDLSQDEDVLDTWFSSALWPFSTLGWPEQTSELKDFYPTSVLVTGFDIIFFWVARMVMFGLKFTGEIPFKEVYIHGLIQDQDGKKMSKSKGNVLDPLDLIHGIDLESLVNKRTSGLMQPKMEERIAKNTRKQYPKGIPSFGTDAVRFTFCALATTGRHIRFDLKRVEGYRNFCNKLWNASRYVFMNTEGHKISKPKDLSGYSIADKWILSKWQSVKASIEDHIAKYRFDLVCKEIYEFTWNDYCDWYLELAKPVLTGEVSDTQKNSTRYNLIFILDELLRVIHPIMPFITEEIWQKLKQIYKREGASDYLITDLYPNVDERIKDDNSLSGIEFVKNLVTGIRNIRAEKNVHPSKRINIKVLNSANNINKAPHKDKLTTIKDCKLYIETLAKVDSIDFIDSANDNFALPLVVDGLEVLIPMEGLINKEEETARLNKELGKIVKDLEKSEKKLNNPSYVEKAPKDVVAKEQNKVKELKNMKQKLEESLEQIAKLA